MTSVAANAASAAAAGPLPMRPSADVVASPGSVDTPPPTHLPPDSIPPSPVEPPLPADEPPVPGVDDPLPTGSPAPVREPPMGDPPMRA